MLSTHKELRSRFIEKEKGKKKMVEYDTNKEESDWSDSDSRKHEDRPLEMKSDSDKRALKSANEKLRQSTR